MDFDKLQVAKVYKAARALPQETMEMWAELLLKHVDKNKINYILDLGCGTGRFSHWLSEVFDAPVIGIDPGKTMLLEARKVEKGRVSFREGSAENIPLENGSTDLIFMSMMYHAVENKPQARKEVYRVLKPGRYLVIRQPTIDSNALCKFLEYFPESLEIGNSLTETNEQLISDFTKSGFELVHTQNVMQKVSKSFKEYLEQIKLKGISIIRMLPEDVFKKRLAEFKVYVDAHANEPVVDSRALFIFSKS